MFKSDASIDFEIFADRIRSELALLARNRARQAGPVGDANQEAIAPHQNEAAATASLTNGVPLPSAAPENAPKTGLRGAVKQVLKGIPAVRDTVRTLRTRGEAVGARLLPFFIDTHRRDTASTTNSLPERGVRTILFVGPCHEVNAQLELVRVLGILRLTCVTPVRLILAGPIRSADYFNKVQAEVRDQGLEDVVRIAKDPGAAELEAFYRTADLYLSLSFRDVFFAAIRSGPPMVRAMGHDVPVVAVGAGAISSALGAGGLFLEARDNDVIACVAKLFLEEPWLRRQIVHAQRRAIAGLEKISLRRKLSSFSRKTRGGQPRLAWRIEGPFDSSYSLAIVNREVARALAEQGETVGLVSRDGPGPFAPSSDFLNKNPAIAQLWRTGQGSFASDVALRNTYPPWVSDLAGELRGTVCYAWEESGFPENYTREFNYYLDVVTVTSRYVAKVLRDNGLRVPIRVIGDGIDQIIRPERADDEPDATRKLITQKFGIGDRFCFLHVSSCFPRKAPDVLLRAWAKAFRDVDNVVLVIKASPNEYHQIEEEVAFLSKTDPHHASIVVINRSIDDADVRGLYLCADVVVAPSRGEGFGLPLAEALALGKPVITTAFGGQMDFCSTESAWFCDFDFAYARSHLSMPLSVWAEPRLDSLVDCLRKASAAPANERSRRGQIGQMQVRGEFTWHDVADRLVSAVADVRALDTRALRLPKVGWISTWNSRCGIAGYSDALASAFPPGHLVVFANYNAQLLGPDAPFVKRTWEQGWRDPLDQLYEAVVDAGVDAIVIQFNFGFLTLDALGRLVDRLSEKAIAVYIGLHSTVDIERPDLTIRLTDARASLSRARRLLVHSVHDLNRLKASGFVDNVTLLPFGLPSPPVERQRSQGPRQRIATFGYLLAHKGLPELIEAVALLRREGMDVDLLMLNALYPAEESQRMQTMCEQLIRDHGLSEYVRLRTDYLAEDEVVAELATADLVVYPYQQTQESASAAVRLGLASLSPVATTPLAIFDDVASITHRLPGTAPEDLAAGIRRLLVDPTARSQFADRQKAWVMALQWDAVSRRLYNIIRGEVLADLMLRPQPATSPNRTVSSEPKLRFASDLH